MQQDDRTPKIDTYQGVVLSVYDQAMINLAESTLANDLQVFKSFASIMITLSTALFPVYFAVLALIKNREVHFSSSVVLSVLFPLTLILSIFLFAGSLFPSKDTINPDDLLSIKSFRQHAIDRKSRFVWWGFLVFSFALVIMAAQFLVVLY